MEHVRWSSEPRLRTPVVVCAFAGWNDAGEAATLAVRHLAETWAARPFAVVDAEEFFDFSTVRPQVRMVDGVTREVMWPHTEMLAAPVLGAAHDVILVVGIEPQLRWRTFCQQVISVAQKYDAQLVVTLGALLADVPHTREVAIIGTAADHELIESYELTQSRYEGPTGIVGVLHDQCAKAGLRSLSLWAAVPGYAQQHASPKAGLALVERASAILGVPIAVGALREQAVAYERDVSEAVADDEDLASYVERLEHFADAGISEDDDEFDEEPERAPELSADELVAEVEQFLRDQGQDG